MFYSYNRIKIMSEIKTYQEVWLKNLKKLTKNLVI